MDISCKVSKNTYVTVCGDNRVSITFPKGMIDLSKHAFNKTNARNNAFSVTWPLSSKESTYYGFGEVFFKDFILKTCHKDVPTVADENNIDTDRLFKEFDDTKNKINFKNKKEEDHEFNKKLLILKKFKREFKNKSYVLYDTTERVLNQDFPSHFKDFVSSTTLLHYTLLAMPIAKLEQVKSILVGNEQNMNDEYTNNDGVKTIVNPDQTSEFMQEFNSLLSTYTNNNNQVVSLIEPIYNLFEIKMLYSRYPELLKYVMSCADERLKRGERWCLKCPMCAKAFLYTKALGLEPKRIHLYDNFFEKRHKNLYPLFNKSPERTHEKPLRMRDEQLLSFYLAYKKGSKGYLVEKFKKEFLDEAKERYEELHKTFFGIHPAPSIPKEIKQDIISIYKEEMNKL
jgi:hypothetical protein